MHASDADDVGEGAGTDGDEPSPGALARRLVAELAEGPLGLLLAYLRERSKESAGAEVGGGATAAAPEAHAALARLQAGLTAIESGVQGLRPPELVSLRRFVEAARGSFEGPIGATLALNLVRAQRETRGSDRTSAWFWHDVFEADRAPPKPWPTSKLALYVESFKVQRRALLAKYPGALVVTPSIYEMKGAKFSTSPWANFEGAPCVFARTQFMTLTRVEPGGVRTIVREQRRLLEVLGARAQKHRVPIVHYTATVPPEDAAALFDAALALPDGAPPDAPETSGSEWDVAPRVEVEAATHPVEAPRPPDRIEVACSCGRRFRAAAAHAGKRVACPGCGQKVLLTSDRCGCGILPRDGQAICSACGFDFVSRRRLPKLSVKVAPPPAPLRATAVIPKNPTYSFLISPPDPSDRVAAARWLALLLDEPRARLETALAAGPLTILAGSPSVAEVLRVLEPLGFAVAASRERTPPSPEVIAKTKLALKRLGI